MMNLIHSHTTRCALGAAKLLACSMPRTGKACLGCRTLCLGALQILGCTICSAQVQTNPRLSNFYPNYRSGGGLYYA